MSDMAKGAHTISFIACSPLRRRPDNRVYRLELRNNTLFPIASHANGVSALCVNAINVVSCDYDGVVAVTSCADPTQQRRYKGAAGELHSVAVSPSFAVWTNPSTKAAVQYIVF